MHHQSARTSGSAHTNSHRAVADRVADEYVVMPQMQATGKSIVTLEVLSLMSSVRLVWSGRMTTEFTYCHMVPSERKIRVDSSASFR